MTTLQENEYYVRNRETDYNYFYPENIHECQKCARCNIPVTGIMLQGFIIKFCEDCFYETLEN